MYYAYVWLQKGTSSVAFVLDNATYYNSGYLSPAAYAQSLKYFNANDVGESVRFGIWNNGAATTSYIDDAYLARLTDCATTGALITGSDKVTRTWISRHASFAPNGATSYKIFKVG
jgi:hypothetical protein